MRRKALLLLAILCFLVVFFLAKEVFGEEVQKTVKTSLQVSFSAMDWADLTMSYIAVRGGWAEERNLIGGRLLPRPALAVTVSIVKQTAFWTLTDAVYKQNKTLAWIIIGAAVIYKGYVLTRNFSVIRGG
jgi:hypothetical protein